jgi:hypothetical protein
MIALIYGDELAAFDTEMQNGLMGEAHFNDAISATAFVMHRQPFAILTSILETPSAT